MLPSSVSQNTPERIWRRVFRENIAFLTLVTLLRSVALRLTNGLPATPGISESFNRPETSSVIAPSQQTDMLPLLQRLAELEEKLETLQAKPTAMPSDKEELLNAAMYRVDALEAELISTKKVTDPP